MKRICCFCEIWESGGIESFLNNILQHVNLSGLQLDIVASRIGKSVFTAGLEAMGVRFIELSGTLRSFRNYSLFRKLLRENQYNVVHFNLFQGLSLYYVQIAKKEGVPVRIAHSHNTALRKSASRPLKLLLHRTGSALFSGSATDFWACSSAAGNFLFARKKAVRFIPNGIETERFLFDAAARDAVRAGMGLTDAFVIGNVGRLCYQKNQDFLLDVFAEVLKIRPESRLLLIGEGDLREHLEKKAMQLGISEKVIFFGVTNHVEQLYWAMDVFAFPSLFEGLGIAAVEAQAAGLPVVMSEHIPPEAAVTARCLYVPLSCEKSHWAQSLVRCGDDSSAGRENSCHDVRRSGFDVMDVAAVISGSYRHEEMP